jgi:hypothetical protein
VVLVRFKGCFDGLGGDLSGAKKNPTPLGCKIRVCGAVLVVSKIFRTPSEYCGVLCVSGGRFVFVKAYAHYGGYCESICTFQLYCLVL